MSIATLLGFIVAIGIVITAMAMGPSILMFVDVPSMLIVIGGTAATTLVRYSISEVGNAFALQFKVLKIGSEDKDITSLIDKTVEMLQVSRKKGILALENYDVDNEFFQRGIQMLVDGYKPEQVKKILQEEHDLYMKRSDIGAGVFSAIADTAPAFGMIGTLVGLVQMLGNLSDPNAIGPAMAVALLTTLYGAMIAQLYASPVADKIKMTAEEAEFLHQFIIEAVDTIAQGVNPGMAKDILSVYLPGGAKAKQAEKE